MSGVEKHSSQSHPVSTPKSAVGGDEGAVPFTPGPWELEVSEDGHTILMGEAIDSPWNYESHLVIEYHHGIEIDDDDGQPNPQWAQAEANANLIAAAPEMFEALSGLFEGLETIAPWERLRDDDVAALSLVKLKRARAALRKALGESQ